MKMCRFEGRNVLVVGGAGSLGSATALRLAREGADLVLVGRDRDRLDAARLSVQQQAGTRCEVVACDVTRAEDWDLVVEHVRSTMGVLHAVANFAAVLSRAGLEDTSVEDWDEILSVNLTGGWLAVRAAMPLLRAAGGGSIVNVGSIDALAGRPASTAYAASKGGLRALTRSAAIQYAPKGVRVNSVHPAPMETRVSHMVGPSDPGLDVAALLASLVAQIPLARLGAAADVAAAVAFLLSDDAAFITGVDLPVDGGYTAR